MKPLAFTYGLTYGGVLASLLRPYVALLIYVCFAIIKPDSLWSWTVPEGNYSRIVALGLLGGWILNGCGSWALGRARGIILALIGYWLITLVGALLAPDKTAAWEPVEPLAKILLPVVVGITLIDSIDKVKQLVWVIVLSQGFLAYEFNLTYYTTIFDPVEFTHGGLDNNGIAISMVTSAGMAFFLGIQAQKLWQKGLVFLLAGLMAHVVLFSNSRGGMVAMIVTGIASFLLVPKQPKHYLVLALAVLLVLRLAGKGVQERFATIFAEKAEGGEGGRDKGGKRLDHWAACLQSVASRPLGVGPNHWPLTAPLYGLPKMAAHSTWLQMAAELGIPGIYCLGSFYGICVIRLWRLRRDDELADPWQPAIARMVIASLVGFIVSAQFVTTDGTELPYYITLAGAGTLKLLGTTASRRASDAPSPNGEDETGVAGALEPV